MGKYKILIIDDKEAFRRKFKRLLYFKENADKFFVQYEAQNGLEAADIIKNNDVDIVITDIRMPIVDGIELLKLINSESLCKCTILLSEYADFSYAKEGILNGAFDYIVKPIDNEKIQDTLDRAFDYLERFDNNVDLLTKKIELLVNCLIDNDKKNTRKYANYLTDTIKEQCLSIEDSVLTTNHILEQICRIIIKRRVYIVRYSPITEICTIKENVLCEDKLFEIFTNRIESLQQEINKFSIKTNSSLIKKVCEYIIQNVENEINLQIITNEFFVNKKYLSTLFKSEVGMSFVDYVTFVKIERAKMLLEESEAKVYEIAANLGYSDKDYFSKVFKKATGQSPSTYKREKLI